ncbi:MAG: DNA-directed RNA polymerase subunit omega [bacterium]
MNERNLEDLLVKAKNKFMLSNAAAGRAKQIVDGSLPYVNNFDPNNPVITALREIAADKIRIKTLSGPSQKAEDLIARDEIDERPSILDSLSKDAKEKKKAPEKKKKK